MAANGDTVLPAPASLHCRLSSLCDREQLVTASERHAQGWSRCGINRRQATFPGLATALAIGERLDPPRLPQRFLDRIACGVALLKTSQRRQSACIGRTTAVER